MKKMRNLVTALYLCGAACMASAATELHVTPDAQPGGDGSAENPFATLVQARDAIRALKKAKGLPEGGVTVYLHDGMHQLNDPLVLTSEDSGTAEAPVVWTATPGAVPVVSGGRVVTGWHGDKERPGVYKAVLDDPPAQIRELYVNNRWATRAGRDVERPTRKQRKQGKTDGFWWWKEEGDGYDVPSDVATWKNLSDVEVIGSGIFRHQIGAIDSLTVSTNTHSADIDFDDDDIQTVEPLGGGDLGPGLAQESIPPKHVTHVRMDPDYWRWQHAHKWGPATRIENALELLDEPGEFYFDRSAGTLYYYPLAQEQIEQAEVVVPILERLVTCENAENITLSGLQFSHAAWFRPRSWSQIQATAHFHGPADTKYEHWLGYKGGIGFPNSIYWTMIPGNVSLWHSRQVILENCRFAYLGGTGLALERGCRENRVVGCDFTSIAGAGIRIGESATPEVPEADRIIDNRIERCRVANVARSYWGSTGIETYYTIGTVLSHNDVHTLPYTGISVGWGWGVHLTKAGVSSKDTLSRPRIDGNYITAVMRRCGDGGGIYLLGSQPGGRVVRNALIGHKIYLDMKTDSVTFEDNCATGFKFNVCSPEDNTVLRNFIFGRHGSFTTFGSREPLADPAEPRAIIAEAGTGPLQRHLAVRFDFTHGLYNDGYGPDGSPIGSVQFATIDGRPCVRLAGEGQALAVNAGDLFLKSVVKGCTVAFWLRPSGTGRQILLDGGHDWPRMELVDGAVEVEQRIGAGKIRSPKALPGNRWTHVAYVAFGKGQGTSKLYVDGIEVAHRSGIGKRIGTDRVLVGGHLVAEQEELPAPLSGAVSDFRIYEHPLSPTQIGGLIDE